MKGFISRLISGLKGEPYTVDSGLRLGDLLATLFCRGIQVLRGCFWRLWFRKCRGLLFVGRDVRISFPGRISAGRNLILGDGCRIDALSRGGIILGDNVSFGKECAVEMTGVLRELGEFLVIGDHVGMASRVFLGVRGSVQIGNNTIIGPNVGFYAENHSYSDPDMPIRLQGASRKGITVGEDCWIGAGAIVLDGVRIGNGCVIAAGAVVNRDIPDYSVAGGAPVKILKKRAAHENIDGQ